MSFKEIVSSITRIGFGALAAGVAIAQFFFTIDAGESAILFDRFQGVKPKVYKEGMHFLIPFVQKPKLFEVRARPRVVYSISSTKDLQIANISLTVLFRPDPEFLPEIFLKLGEDYERKVVSSTAKDVLKGVIGKYKAEELLNQRKRISTKIRTKLAQRVAKFHILIDETAITHLTFGPEFVQAIESKQIEQQNAEK